MKTKERWELAAKLGEKLGTTKTAVFKVLTDLQEAELVDKILAGDEEIIKQVKQMMVKVLHPDQATPLERDVKLALWAYEMIGDHAKAKVAFDKVIRMFEETTERA